MNIKIFSEDPLQADVKKNSSSDITEKTLQDHIKAIKPSGGNKGGTFFTSKFFWNSGFHGHLENPATKELDFTSLSLSWFYHLTMVTKKHNNTYRNKLIYCRQLEIVFDLFATIHLVDFMRGSFGTFLESITISSTDFHIYGLSFGILRPCFILADYLTEKYMHNLFDTDNGKKVKPKKLTSTKDENGKTVPPDGIWHESKYTPGRNKLNCTIRCLLLDQAFRLQ